MPMQPKRSRGETSTARRRDTRGKLDFGGLENLLGYRLRRAQGAAHRLFMSRMTDLELTQRQAAILWLAQCNPGVVQSSLATALAMDRATTMAVVDRLQDRGLVRRERSTSDRRRQEILITPAGERVLLRVRERIQQLEDDYRDLFTPAELGKLLGLLQRIRAASETPRPRRSPKVREARS